MLKYFIYQGAAVSAGVSAVSSPKSETLSMLQDYNDDDSVDD